MREEEPVAAVSTSPTTRLMPGTSTSTSSAWQRDATFSIVTEPSAFRRLKRFDRRIKASDACRQPAEVCEGANDADQTAAACQGRSFAKEDDPR
jgi:hypothetical protein